MRYALPSGGREQGDGDPALGPVRRLRAVGRAELARLVDHGHDAFHTRVRQFLRDVHEVAARQGCLDLNLLLVDDRPAAFAYNYCHQGLISDRAWVTSRNYRPAARERSAASGPEDTFRRGDRLYDFGPGYPRLQTALADVNGDQCALHALSALRAARATVAVEALAAAPFPAGLRGLRPLCVRGRRIRWRHATGRAAASSVVAVSRLPVHLPRARGV